MEKVTLRTNWKVKRKNKLWLFFYSLLLVIPAVIALRIQAVRPRQRQFRRRVFNNLEDQRQEWLNKIIYLNFLAAAKA